LHIHNIKQSLIQTTVTVVARSQNAWSFGYDPVLFTIRGQMHPVSLSAVNN